MAIVVGPDLMPVHLDRRAVDIQAQVHGTLVAVQRGKSPDQQPQPTFARQRGLRRSFFRQWRSTPRIAVSQKPEPIAAQRSGVAAVADSAPTVEFNADGPVAGRGSCGYASPIIGGLLESGYFRKIMIYKRRIIYYFRFQACLVS